jgi:hypothetical protein
VTDEGASNVLRLDRSLREVWGTGLPAPPDVMAEGRGREILIRIGVLDRFFLLDERGVDRTPELSVATPPPDREPVRGVLGQDASGRWLLASW